MFKKIVAALLMGALVAGFSFSAYADTVRVDGISRQLAISPVTVEGSQLVGMREVSGLFGAAAWVDEATGAIVAKNADVEVRLYTGSTEATINGEPATIPVAARTVNNNTMIPLRFLAEAFGYSVNWDVEKAEPVLEKLRPEPRESGSNEPVSLLDLDALKPAEGAIVLKFDEALARMIARNTKINDLNASAPRMREEREEIRIDTSWQSSPITAAYIVGIRGIAKIEYDLLNVPLRIEMLMASDELALRTIINSIEQSRTGIQMLDELIRLRQFNLENNLQLRFELGLASENDVRDAKRTLEDLQRDRERLNLSLAMAKENLALMLGYNATDDVEVDYHTETFENDIDLDSLLRNIPKEPSIVIVERAFKLTEFIYESPSPPTSWHEGGPRPESKHQQRIAMDEANRALEDAKSDMEKKIRDAYNAILRSKEAQKANELALQKARDTYATALVNLEAGNITQHDADMARLDILKAEIEIRNNNLSAGIRRFSIERPYLPQLP